MVCVRKRFSNRAAKKLSSTHISAVSYLWRPGRNIQVLVNSAKLFAGGGEMGKDYWSTSSTV
jgi:hypothetical protein